MVIRHLEETKTTGAQLGYCRTPLIASYKIFLMSVLTSMFDPRAPTLPAAEEERKRKGNEEEWSDLREVAKKSGTILFRI